MLLITRLFTNVDEECQALLSVGVIGTLTRDTYSLATASGDVMIPSGSVVLITAQIVGGEWIEILSLDQKWTIHRSELVKNIFIL